MVYDLISFYIFVKNKKAIEKKGGDFKNGNDLIPWKSTNDKNDHGIPLRATIISFLFSILFATFWYVIMSLILFDSKKFPRWIVFSILMGINTIRLPLTLILTIKKKNSIQQSQPPKKLQFHEEYDNSVSFTMFY